jgi:hypothetical protein
MDHNLKFDPADPNELPKVTGRAGRAKRVITTAAASTILLGAGAAIGVALTGGASASTAGGTSTTVATVQHRDAIRHQCLQLALDLRSSGHPTAARRVAAFCRVPLLRLAAVGGVHGQVTFETKNGPKTLAFERGTIQSASASEITVVAKDGTTWTWDVLPSTIVRSAGQTVAANKLAVGEQVFVGGPVVSGVNDALLIRIRAATQPPA